MDMEFELLKEWSCIVLKVKDINKKRIKNGRSSEKGKERKYKLVGFFSMKNDKNSLRKVKIGINRKM